MNVKGADGLLSRDAFRTAVFARDDGRCVACGAPAVDAHHILERRLFDDGGYYLANGASVCAPCHLAAEQTTLSVEELRHAAGITRPALPGHFYDDVVYDKWGNTIAANGTRGPGELFNDDSARKALRDGNVLDRFRPYVKYPRTPHLPWSPGVGSDDRVLTDTAGFAGLEVVVTEKLDGECTTAYPDGYVHARSIDGALSNPSRSWVKNDWSQRAFDLPTGWRVCGENMWAVHSIHYDDLPSYFAVFSIWDQHNRCLPWDDTADWCALLDLTTVPVLWRGVFDEPTVAGLWCPADRDRVEGYVVRPAAGFAYRDFRNRVAKFVRPDHVSTDRHWFGGRRVESNRLAN